MRLRAAVAAWFTMTMLLAAEQPVVALTTADIVARMVAADLERTPKLLAYTSLRRYSLENQRFGMRASMTVRMTYRSPGIKKFEILEQSGPAAVRSKVFQRMLDSESEASTEKARQATQIGPQNYDFRLLDSESIDGRTFFVLQAEPKTKNEFLFRGRIWVDAGDFAVTRIEGAPAKKPSFWVRKTTFVHRYAKHGEFWLADTNTSDTDVLVFGHTRVRIEYGEYRIESSGTPDADTH